MALNQRVPLVVDDEIRKSIRAVNPEDQRLDRQYSGLAKQTFAPTIVIKIDYKRSIAKSNPNHAPINRHFIQIERAQAKRRKC